MARRPSLAEYERKRPAGRSPEPRGGPGSESGNRYVVQHHLASHDHYDFRLELGGVLLSWAVPKGPSLDPAQRRLAVEVEPHPVEYASFEGTIPEGEYGAGTVMVWDRGTWEAQGEDAKKGFDRGRLKFTLHGEKLKGGWMLARMGAKSGAGKPSWLLIKEKDRYAKPESEFDVRAKKPGSVLSGKTMEQIAKAKGRVWRSNRRAKAGPKKKVAGTRKTTAVRARPRGAPSRAARIDASETPGAVAAKQPTRIDVQLATLTDDVPRGEGWLHEIKFDGYRIACVLKSGRARLHSRNGKDWTARFKRVAVAAEEHVSHDAILDGEVVALDEHGVSQFQMLQNALTNAGVPLVYYVFDLLWIDGYDVRGCSQTERKRLLAELLPPGGQEGVVRYSAHIAGGGEAVYENACRLRLEGVISKRAADTYRAGRGRSWLKVKCNQEQEFVIGGFTEPGGGRAGLGSLLLGYYDEGRLIHCGRVGTGFTDQTLRTLRSLLDAREIKASPFVNKVPAAGGERVRWVRPELVGQVEFLGWTGDGSLRHPSFRGLREDKDPADVVREKPGGDMATKKPARRTATKSAKPAPKATGGGDNVVAGVTITHPQRVVYPELGITKLELARYYEGVAEEMLPHVVNRPLSIVRCPEGQMGECFFQKHMSGVMPDALHGIPIEEKNGEGVYLAIRDVKGLISLIQMGAMEIHPWGCREEDIEHPDRLIFDLDPGPGVEWRGVVEAAKGIRDHLAGMKLESFVKTSGGKGLHVVAPIRARATWEQAKEFCRGVAAEFSLRDPKRYIAVMTKAKREGRIFIDYLRNSRGATSVAPFSTRARSTAAVSAPIAWSESKPSLGPAAFTVRNLPARLERLRTDPWAGFFRLKQALPGD